MQGVYFPIFNKKFEFSKIAFHFLNIDVYWYALIIVFAIILSIFLLYKKKEKFGILYNDILDFFIYAIPISFIGARIYYVIFNMNYYRINPYKIFSIRDGGLAIYGGIITGVIFCYFFCKKKNMIFLDFLDCIAPYLCLCQSIGRIGNFVNVEAYGTNTNLPWRMGIIQNGNYIEVHPTFLYESIFTFLIFLILSYFSKKGNRKFQGQITYIYLVLYSFVRFFIEELRIDSLLFFGYKISKIISLLIFVIFCLILAYNLEKNKTRKDTPKKHRKKSYENCRNT